MRKPWTPHDRQLVLERYAADGPAALADELGRSMDSVSSLARRYGRRSLWSRKRQADSRSLSCRSINTQFFEHTSLPLAYVVGLIWACGTVKTKHRHVLRLTLPTDRVGCLRQVRELMECRHSIQTYEHTVVLEVPNRFLVCSLLRRLGSPPRSAEVPQPPRLPENLIARFASGHLAATSRRTGNHIHWRGPHVVMDWLSTAIQAQVNVPPPEIVSPTTREQTIRWQKIPDVRAIETWLGVTG